MAGLQRDGNCRHMGTGVQLEVTKCDVCGTLCRQVPWTDGGLGFYAEYACVDPSVCQPLPDIVLDLETAEQAVMVRELGTR